MQTLLGSEEIEITSAFELTANGPGILPDQCGSVPR